MPVRGESLSNSAQSVTGCEKSVDERRVPGLGLTTQQSSQEIVTLDVLTVEHKPCSS